MTQECIAVDLDGTLAYYGEWVAWNVIGPPIPAMVDRVNNWLADGKKVVIFTARCGYDLDQCRITQYMFRREEVVTVVQDWLEAQGLPRLTVTAVKTHWMREIWDDRAVSVERNTGRILTDQRTAEQRALSGAP